ncbi:MAG: hypothetical protein DRP83_03290 [Planctomycetota bacterium]|nr:MAG: hypothetical protein DRP83_03290 [Planctomycetota bacterium]
MNRNTYIFAGGGTGGHLYPGLAVAEALQAVDPAANIVFACSRRTIDRRILEPTGYVIVPQPVLPLPGNPLKLPRFLAAWLRSQKVARDLLEDLQPHAVLGLGGFAAGPVIHASARRGRPTAMLNPDIVPGKANRFLARRVDVIFTQFASTSDCFAPELRPRVSTVGCPVRPTLLEGSRAEALEHFPSLKPSRKTLLIFGGSKLAESVTRAVIALADDFSSLADEWQMLFIVGSKMLDQARDAFAGMAIDAEILEYCQRMDLAWALADLALCRGGAGTVAELSATGTPAVVMPYPHHKDRQQYLNPGELVQARAAKVVEDRCDQALNAEALRVELLPILRDAGSHAAMQAAAKTTARPHVAKDIAAWLIS